MRPGLILRIWKNQTRSHFTRVGSTLVVLGAACVYLARMFRLNDAVFWTTGLGDWIDPYFINALLEHWYASARHLADPSSPPMFFPARGTLGYSHGLVLFAPFYILARLFLHPFQAYSMALLLVMMTGILSLYAIFRVCLALSFVESFLLTAFFATSANVVNGILGVWSQRASVFLIPSILLLFLAAIRMRDGHWKSTICVLSGLLATLLFIQDFYTAQFALLFVVLAGVAVLAIERPALSGTFVRSWQLPFAVGALAGAVLFLAIYFPVYREHPAFPTWELLNQLSEQIPYDSLRVFVLAFGCCALAWLPWAGLKTGPYAPSARSAYLPERLNGVPSPMVGGSNPPTLFRKGRPLGRPGSRGSDVDRRVRLYAAAFALVSVLVLILPMWVRDFSIWRLIFEPLPGFAAIRDPKRVIYLYELAVVLAVGVLLSQLRPRTAPRWIVTILVVVIQEPNLTMFDFLRPNETYAQWVNAPIAIDPSCQSFVIEKASAAYTARQAEMRPVYAIDATFIAITHGIPTLNGYSAWSPPGWSLVDPSDAGYEKAVAEWIERHRLTGVCALDIEKRVIKERR